MTKSKKLAGILSIIKWELSNRRWSILFWVIGIGAFITLNLTTYPSFRDQASELNAIFDKMPQSMIDLLSDTGDFMSPVGFLSSQIFYLMLPMLFMFLSINLGSSLIAREEQTKTIELLLSRPISRGKLLLGKTLSGLAVTLIITFFTAVICAVEVHFIEFEGVKAIDVFLTTLMTMLFSLFFGAIAFALTSMGSLGRKASIAVAALFAISGYVVSSLDATVKWLQTPAKFFPYHYFKPAKILEGHFPIDTALIFTGIIIVLILISWFAFRRRDIE